MEHKCCAKTDHDAHMNMIDQSCSDAICQVVHRPSHWHLIITKQLHGEIVEHHYEGA